jgi:hypothetical protein
MAAAADAVSVVPSGGGAAVPMARAGHYREKFCSVRVFCFSLRWLKYRFSAADSGAFFKFEKRSCKPIFNLA